MTTNYILPPVERVAEKVHKEFIEMNLSRGVTSQKNGGGEELMVEYPFLSEAAKTVVRGAVKIVYEAIEEAAMDAASGV